MSYNYAIRNFEQFGRSSSNAAQSSGLMNRFGLGSIFDPRRFQSLMTEWQKETALISSVASITQHPSYQSIIQMGWAALPYILRELERRPDHWFVALHAITGADPVLEEDRGRMKKMAQAWIDWGRDYNIAI